MTHEELAKAHDILNETLTRMAEKLREGKRLNVPIVDKLRKPLYTVSNSAQFAENIDELDNAMAVLCSVWDMHVIISNHHYLELFKIVGKFGAFLTRSHRSWDDTIYSNSLLPADFGPQFIGGKLKNAMVPAYFSIEPWCLPREAQTKLVSNRNKGGWLTTPILLHEPEPDSTYIYYLDPKKNEGAHNDITHERRSYDFLTDENVNSALAEWENYRTFVLNYIDLEEKPFLNKKAGGPTATLAACVRHFRAQRACLRGAIHYACWWAKKNVNYDPQEEALIDLTDRLRMYQGVRPMLYLRPEDINKNVVGDFPVKCLYRPPLAMREFGV